METGERITRVREVRRRLVREGPPRTRDRARDFETVTLPERDCDLLRDQGKPWLPSSHRTRGTS